VLERLEVSYNDGPVACENHKASLGQYFTPSNVAEYMASLIELEQVSDYHLLDAGAGVGALSCAFIERFKVQNKASVNLKVTAFEYDKALIPSLEANISASGGAHQNVVQGDFIEIAAQKLLMLGSAEPMYTHVLLNPPYKKIRSNSQHRAMLRSIGIETTNLYAGFIGAALLLTKINGVVVALVPRSFCTGPYFKRFREFILGKAAIRQIHLFESRNAIFREDGVLQENIIIKLERGGAEGDVLVTSSVDGGLIEVKSALIPFSQVVRPDDSDLFIHIPNCYEESEWPRKFIYSLEDLGVSVSTGPVVDFRVPQFLAETYREGSVPLLYPAHLKGSKLTWPILGLKKPQYLQNCKDTLRQLFPAGNYCVVRRFSAKEQERRIVSAVANREYFKEFDYLGFENHLNVIHAGKNGLELSFVSGLTGFLNSKYADKDIRTFNGHTQVNAADLKKLRFPSAKFLNALGDWILSSTKLEQDSVDKFIDTLLEKEEGIS
jgi:tRNA1(Val) A37 N6-methylase TrmN6